MGIIHKHAHINGKEAFMTALKAVVFDMDDTLLSINLNAFIGMFALDEANLLAQAARKSTVALFTSVGSAMLELNNGERAEGDIRTNQRFFADEVERRCGVPLLEPAILDMLEFYEREILPKRTTASSPRVRAREPTRRLRPYSIAGSHRPPHQPELLARLHRVSHGLGRHARHALRARDHLGELDAL